MTNYQNDLLNKLKRYLPMSDEVATFIVAQSVLETANFTSEVCRENNNLFGMKYPKVRVTTALCENRFHAVYSSYIDSVIDYVIWLSYQHFSKTDLIVLDKFKSKLQKSNYCPSPDYIKRIDSVYKLITNLNH